MPARRRKGGTLAWGMRKPVSTPRHAAIAAALLFAGSVVGFGALFPVFSQWAHPVAMLGATGVPRAPAFNLLAFIVPGLLSAFVAYAMRDAMADARWTARLGAWALVLAGLAFSLQGVFPLDSHDLHADGSRWHAVMWTFWWIAFTSGAAMLAIGEASRRGLGIAMLSCAATTLLFALAMPGLLPVGLSQRIAFAGWFLATLLLGARLSRSAA